MVNYMGGLHTGYAPVDSVCLLLPGHIAVASGGQKDIDEQSIEEVIVTAHQRAYPADSTTVDSSPRIVTADFDAVGPLGLPVENLVSIQPRKTVGEGETCQATLKSFIDFDGPTTAWRRS